MLLQKFIDAIERRQRVDDKMLLSDFKKEKRILDEAISILLSDFTKQTGVSVRGINIVDIRIEDIRVKLEILHEGYEVTSFLNL